MRPFFVFFNHPENGSPMMYQADQVEGKYVIPCLLTKYTQSQATYILEFEQLGFHVTIEKRCTRIPDNEELVLQDCFVLEPPA